MGDKIYNLKNIDHRQLKSSKELFSLSAVLSELFGFKKIFIHHEILQPGKRSSSPHAHTKREEMIISLEGSLSAYLGDKIWQLQPGDCIGFKPNEVHWIENNGPHDTNFLVIASSDVDDEVIYTG